MLLLIVGLLLVLLFTIYTPNTLKSGGDDETITELIEYNNPIDLYKDGIYIVAHICGDSDGGIVDVYSYITENYPDIAIYHIYPAPSNKDELNKVKQNILEFLKANISKPVFIFGYNSSDNQWLNIPAIYCMYIGDYVEKIVNRKYAKLNKDNKLEAQTVINMLNSLHYDEWLYGKHRYWLQSASDTTSYIPAMIYRTQQKIALVNDKVKPIIHLSGESGSGKSDLAVKIINKYGDLVEIIDLDDIFFGTFKEFGMSDDICEKAFDKMVDKIKVINKSGKYCVMVGVSCKTIPLPDYGFIINTPADLVNIRRNKRELNRICHHVDDINNKLSEADKAILKDPKQSSSILTSAMDYIHMDLQFRGCFFSITNVDSFNSYWQLMKYHLLDEQHIISRIGELIA